MAYFKHNELVANFKVSLKTVHNWIDAAKQGKTALRLYQTKGRTYVANTPENILILKQLSAKGKKYRNLLHHKIVQPTAEFYDIYDRRQILDIIKNLEVHKEIPRQYNYFKDGARNWDNWLKRLSGEETSNILTGTIELIRTNMEAIDRFITGAKKINVIDLGVGNAYPVKDLLGHLIDKGVLHRYVGVDLSASMLSIAESNVKKWYGDKVKFEGHIRDISYEHFDDLLIRDRLDDEANRTINLVLLMGATPVNFRSYGDVFKAAFSSMGRNDLLLCADIPDTEASRHNLDFNSLPAPGKLSPNHQYILDLMNVDESFYEVEMGFDSVRKMRYVRVRLTAPLTIKFNFGTMERTVNLEKGDTILLLRVWHLTTLEMFSNFEETGFKLLQSSLTNDRRYLLTISGVDTRD